MTNSIYSLARAASRVLGFFRADPAQTPPTPPTGNVADLTGRLTPIGKEYTDIADKVLYGQHGPGIPFGKRREPPPPPANDPPSRPFKTTRDGVTCWTECGPDHCAYPGNCVASFGGSFIDTEGTRTPLGAVPILDDTVEVQRRQERARATGRWPM